MADRRGNLGAWLPWAVAWLAVVPLALIRAQVLAEADTFWQARTGLLIVETGRVPAADPFSWTAAGAPWRPNSWAFDVLLALAYRAGELPGLALLGVAFVLAIAAVLLWTARRWGAPPAVAALVLVAGLPAVAGWLSVRPQLVDYAAVPLLLMLLEATAAAGRRWWVPAAGIGLLQAVWVNLHASALLGVGVIVVWTAAHLVVRRPPAGSGRGRWGAVLLAAIAGTLANPAGFGVIAQALHVRTESVDIEEWGALRPTDVRQLILLAVAAAAVFVAWRRRWYPLAAVVAALAAGGVLVIRLLPVAAVLSLPVLAAGVSAMPGPARWLADRRRLVAGTVAAFAVTFLVIALAGVGHLGRPDSPARAVAALPSGCRLFNGEIVGGLIILRRPDVAVSLDTRNDLYGAARLRAHYAVENAAGGGPGAMAALGVTCVLVPPETPLAAQLRADPGWREVVREPDGSLFLPQPRLG
jgi:hypothetical protein